MRIISLLSLFFFSIFIQITSASEPAFKQLSPARLLFDPSRAVLVQNSDNSVTIYDKQKSVDQGSPFRCECTSKKKTCSVQVSQNELTCGGPRCCELMTWDIAGGSSFESRPSVCP